TTSRRSSCRWSRARAAAPASSSSPASRRRTSWRASSTSPPSTCRTCCSDRRAGSQRPLRMTDTAGFLQPHVQSWAPWLYTDSRWWTVFGVAGNLLFSSRFLLQWLHSERKRELVVPPLFWHLSFWGSVVSLVYAL